jgi:2-haloacid dehalogenase
LLRLYAPTTFSNEPYSLARERFEFLGWFDDVVVSGEYGIVKPDPRIFELAIRRCELIPARTVFIDDTPVNIAAAREFGLHSLHFTGAARLRADLEKLGLL